jgi:hypothetical protein
MKPIAFAILFASAMGAAGPALAKVPYFAAKCPMDISVETSRGGAAYINGKKASVRALNANFSEIRGSGVTISVSRDAGGLLVSYNAKGRANGMCPVVEQEQAEAAPAAGAPMSTTAAANVPSADKRACLRAVRAKTRNSQVTVISTDSSEANNTVTVGVGSQRAPWRCLVKRGKVADVMSQTDEGAL